MMSGDPGSMVLALSGGVGGAKLALGLANTLPPEDLTTTKFVSPCGSRT